MKNKKNKLLIGFAISGLIATVTTILSKKRKATRNVSGGDSDIEKED